MKDVPVPKIRVISLERMTFFIETQVRVNRRLGRKQLELEDRIERLEKADEERKTT